MSTTSSTEIQQLKEFIKDNFNDLDRKIDKVQTELKEDINKLDGKIEQVQADIKGLDRRLRDIELNQAETKGRMDEWKTSIQKIPDLSEKFGELKNW